nr:hypothetical protein [Tanacetum cinerariifolium]
SETYVLAFVKEIDYVQLGIVNQDGLKLQPKAFFWFCTAAYTESSKFQNTIFKEAVKFVRDFKSLAKEADESLAKDNALEYKIERLLRAVIKWLQAQLGDFKGKIDDTPCISDTLDPLSQKPEDENVALKFQVLNYAKENEHLKTTYKNLFDSIKVTRAQTKLITDSLKEKLHDTVYENTMLRAQLFDKVSEQKDTSKGVDIAAKTRRPQPMSNTKNDRVPLRLRVFASRIKMLK